MLRTFKASLLTLLLGTACSAAHADQPMGPMPPPDTAIAIGIAPAKVRAPYDVQVIREGGETLPTYGLKDRFYVQGNAGERYVIRVTNPTANRVEAVVTVDGLDVIDGESGDLRKRGYVVPPYGEVRIEGFRTSQADVATFRFSAVDDSYAGKKGKARNVGVIAVAIFEEQHAEQPQIIVGGDIGGGGYGRGRKYDYTDDLDEGAPATADRSPAPAPTRVRPMAKKDSVGAAEQNAPRPAPARESVSVRDGRRGGGEGAKAKRAPDSTSTGVARRQIEADDSFDAEMGPPPPAAPRTNRPGLGTEFGEQRYSAASFTKFVRGGRPIAVAELRYNNAAGLAALGINAEPLPDGREIMTRETADPFPGDARYSQPPR